LAALSIAVAPAAAQRKGAAPSGGEIPLIVNGVKVTRAEIFDELVADQTMRMMATDPRFVDKTRPVAGSLGAYLLPKFAGGASSIALTRTELVNWIFKDKPQVLLEAIENRTREMVVQQEAAKKGIKVDPKKAAEQMKEAIKNIRARNQFDTTITDSQVLKKLGFRESTLKRAFGIQYLLDQLVRQNIAEKLKHPIGPSDFVEARHILVAASPQNAPQPATPPDPTKPAPVPDKEKLFESAKKKIDGLAEQIKSGKITFEKAAIENSDDGSKFQEGKLGIFSRGQMVPEFDKVAFELEPGKVSEPIRTQFGWHLIRVDRKGSELTGPEREQALQGLLRQRLRSYVEELVAKAKVTNNVGRPQPQAPQGMQQGG
jgi:foldase protein PrsA